ncbi:MAG: hypothetical protein JXR10_11260 [Cyclobacteriaceae bacterium]
MLSIRYWIVLMVSILIVLTVLALSVISYQEFHKALDDRVLLQLTSIKRLKRNQIEAYLQAQSERFHVRDYSSSKIHVKNDSTRWAEIIGDVNCAQAKLNQIQEGYLDLTSCDESGKTRIFLVKRFGSDSIAIQEVSNAPIQSILLERTGMGESGETYLVGGDMTMRSQSRFFPDDLPGTIEVRTKGVIAANQGEEGVDQFPDYRGIMVYSSYDRLEVDNLSWVILSELDVNEGLAPLNLLKENLIVISIIVILGAMLVALLLTSIFSKPLLNMRDSLLKMAEGDYNQVLTNRTLAKEISEMFSALEQLRTSISGAITFSTEIGKMQLDTEHHPTGKSDLLGHSLLAMREKLIEYQRMESQNRILRKRFLIRGQEEERERIAKELHDGIGPLLTSLKLAIQSAGLLPQEKTNLKNMLDKTIEDVRRVTYDLMPLGLKDFGAGKALSAFVSQIARHAKEEIIYNYEPSATERERDPEIDICVYRIGQELINNGLKHASAKKISLTVTDFEDRVSIFYTDDGVGLKVKEVKLKSGLSNMKIRAEVTGGTISFADIQKGTEIEVEIPLQAT